MLRFCKESHISQNEGLDIVNRQAAWRKDSPEQRRQQAKWVCLTP